MKIILKPHLKIRLKERAIPQTFPRKILSEPDSKYFDNLTGHYIAIKKLEYYGKLRFMVVAYDIINSEVQIITVHPIASQEIRNKIKRERWIKK